MAPRFTIVTPVRNGLPYLAECLDSVAAQGGVCEHIVCDGGSSDGTLELLRARTGIRILEGPDAGQADALAKGFRAACGTPYFGWLNADDRLAPGALDEAARILDAHPEAALVNGDARRIDAAGALTGGITGFWGDEVSLRFLNTLPQPSTFFRRRAYEEIGGLATDLHYTMDADLWPRLTAVGRCLRVPLVWSDFRIHPDSKTGRGVDVFHAEWGAHLARSGWEDGLDAPARAWRKGLDLRAGPEGDDRAADAAFREADGSPSRGVRFDALRNRVELASIRGDLEAARATEERIRSLAREEIPEILEPEREFVWIEYLVGGAAEREGALDEAERRFRRVIELGASDEIRYLGGARIHLARIADRR